MIPMLYSDGCILAIDAPVDATEVEVLIRAHGLATPLREHMKVVDHWHEGNRVRIAHATARLNECHEADALCPVNRARRERELYAATHNFTPGTWREQMGQR